MSKDNINTDFSAEHELSHRITTCNKWEWLPGMSGMPLIDHLGNSLRITESNISEVVFYACGLHRKVHLDLTDRATLGCIEHALLPKIYNSDVPIVPLPTQSTTEWWLIFHDDGSHAMICDDRGHCPESKAEAFVLLLEKATSENLQKAAD